MNNWNTNNNYAPLGYVKPLEMVPSKFWVSENGITAANELLAQLTQGPKLLAQLGTYVKVPGKLKEFLIDSCPVENEIRYDEKGVEWCGLTGNDENYWNLDGKIFSKNKRSPKTQSGKVQYFWGVLSTKEAIFNDENIVLKDISCEKIHSGEGVDDIAFPLVVKSSITDFAIGDFITASKFGDDEPLLWYYMQHNWTPFMIRTWEDFYESNGVSLDDYIGSIKEQDAAKFSPRYPTKYPKILIHDKGKLYSGFQYDREKNVFFLQSAFRSHDTFIGIKSFSKFFYVINLPYGRIHFGEDEFTLITTARTVKWKTLEDFLSDSSFWERLQAPPPPPQEWNAKEIAFLDHFKQYVADCGFKYDDRDLARFHTSVKCGMLTLLGGEPGTGKSSLVELYFRALGGSDNNRESEDSFLRVDVNPSWMEPADLIGFRDQNKVFRPAENGLFNRLRKWNDEDGDRNHLWPICLEEINLACVEHYFSDFIQIISRGNGCLKYERKVSSDDSPNADASEMQCSDGDIAPEECAIRLTDNLRFVGTCNSDETTRSLSLRFLDRCNMIELSLSDEMKERLLDDAFAGRTAKVLPYELEQGHEVSANDFQEWTNHDAGNLEEVKKLLSGLMASFEKAGIAPSPRVIAEIAKYIRNRPPWGIGDGMSSEQDRIICALDESITQRILPHYRPSPMTIPVLRELNGQFQNFGLEQSFMVGQQVLETFTNMMLPPDAE